MCPQCGARAPRKAARSQALGIRGGPLREGLSSVPPSPAPVGVSPQPCLDHVPSAGSGELPPGRLSGLLVLEQPGPSGQPGHPVPSPFCPVVSRDHGATRPSLHPLFSGDGADFGVGS